MDQSTPLLGSNRVSTTESTTSMAAEGTSSMARNLHYEKNTNNGTRSCLNCMGLGPNRNPSRRSTGLNEYSGIEGSAHGDGFNGDDSGYQYRRWCGVRRSNCLLALYAASYLLYLFICGYIMSVMEEDAVSALKQMALQEKAAFLARYPSVKAEDLELFLTNVTNYQRNFNVAPLDANVDKSQWETGQSFLFTVSVVTTIGYGHVYPVTGGGKIFCIAFAAVGIPFTLVFLSAFVQRLLGPTLWVLGSITKFCNGPGRKVLTLKLLQLLILCTFFCIFFIIIPAVIFQQIEPDWTMVDSIYYVFISLTTIGLGDVTPGEGGSYQFQTGVYKVCAAMYLLIGLLFMSLTVTVYYEIPQLNLGLHLHHHRDLYATEGGNAMGSEVPSQNSSPPTGNDNIGSNSKGVA